MGNVEKYTLISSLVYWTLNESRSTFSLQYSSILPKTSQISVYLEMSFKSFLFQLMFYLFLFIPFINIFEGQILDILYQKGTESNSMIL